MTSYLPTIDNVELAIRLSIVEERVVRASYSRHGSRWLARHTTGYWYDPRTFTRRYQGFASNHQWSITLIEAPELDGDACCPCWFTTIISNPMCFDHKCACWFE